MIAAPTKWLRAKRTRPCPVCGRPDWCVFTSDGAVALCTRTPSDRTINSKRTGEFVGYLHKLTGGTEYKAEPRAQPARRHDIAILARQYATAVNPARLTRFAAQVGLTTASLRRLRIGWAADKRAWSFPMVDHVERVVGIRLRTEDGAKFAVTGSQNGLFVPEGFNAGGAILVGEGPTSCAALLDLGYAAIGRPSCSGGGQMLARLLSRIGRRDIVVFGDHDAVKVRPDGSEFRPGQDGAAAIAQLLLPVSRSVKIVIPPFSKDPRDWKRDGATRAVVDAVIRAVNYVRPESRCPRGW